MDTILRNVLLMGVALVAVADANRNIPTECPKDESQNYTINLPDETDCTKYYECSFGEQVLQDCPLMANGERMRYNKVEQACDWPWKVDCVSGSSTPKPATSPNHLTNPPHPGVEGCIGSCQNDDTLNEITTLPHEDCRKWCRCENKVMTVWACPANFYFSPTLKKCTNPKLSGCEAATGSSTTAPSTTRLPTSSQTALPTSSPTSSPTLKPTSSPTPPPTSPQTNSPIPSPPTPSPTLRPESSTTPGPKPSPTPGSTTSPNPSTTTPHPGVEGCIGTCRNDDPMYKITTLPHEDCRKWCRCENKVMTVWVCPANLYFSPTLKKCTNPKLAGCEAATGSSTPAPSTTRLPTSSPTALPTSSQTSSPTLKPSSSPTPSPTSPTSSPTLKPSSSPTPSPTSPQTTSPIPSPPSPSPTLRPKSSTTPGPKPSPTPRSTTSQNPLTTTPNPGVEGCIGTCRNDDLLYKITTLPHEDCRKWCRCENEVVTVWVCPANFYFSPTLKKCTNPKLAGCGGARD